MSLTFAASKRFSPTFIIIALNIAVYVYTSVLSGDFMETSYDVILRYGQVNYLVMKGVYWQLFTAMFIHADIIHISGNMLFLLIFGLRAEEMFKIHEYLLIYFLSGLAGNLLTLLFGPFAPPSVGASGAIFGMLGACTIYVRRAFGQSIVGALLYSLFWLMMSAGPEVNNLAHLGGLIVGLVVGYFLAFRRKLKASHVISYAYSVNV